MLEVSDAEVVGRVQARREDVCTGKIYNLLTNPPPPSVPADRLVARADDHVDVIAKRLRAYRRLMPHVVDQFRLHDIPVVHVDVARLSVDRAFQKVAGVLDRAGASRVVLAGPPGSGKGTQAQLVKDSLGVAHVSTGDLLRSVCL